MANFDKVFKENIIFGVEENGKKYGFTAKTANQQGYNGDFRIFSIDDARKICFEKFWKPFNFSEIQNSKVASEMFEFSRQTGDGKLAIKILQRSFNVLNKNILLVEDGNLGEQTVTSINSYKFYKSLFKTMHILHGMYYILEAEDNKLLLDDVVTHETKYVQGDKKDFVRNWIDKRVK